MKGAATCGRNRAVTRLLAQAQRRIRYVPQWRQIAMGADPIVMLPAIFGAAPSPFIPRHGDTLDA